MFLYDFRIETEENVLRTKENMKNKESTSYLKFKNAEEIVSQKAIDTAFIKKEKGSVKTIN